MRLLASVRPIMVAGIEGELIPLINTGMSESALNTMTAIAPASSAFYIFNSSLQTDDLIKAIAPSKSSGFHAKHPASLLLSMSLE